MKHNSTLSPLCSILTTPFSFQEVPCKRGTVLFFVFRCLLLGLSCRQRRAESWASPATCSAAPVIFSDSLTCFSWTPLAEGAVRRKHNLKPKSCMLELSLKSVDENWGGSLKSKLLSEVISPNCSEVYRSSTFAVQTLS